MIGARGNIKDPNTVITYLQSLKDGIGIPLNADLVCGKDHLVSSVYHAMRSFERQENVSGNLATEILLYASGEKQISHALEKMGIKAGYERIAIVLIGCVDIDEVLSTLELQRDDSLLEFSVEKLRAFGIDERDIISLEPSELEDLILEQVAFVDLIKG